MSTSAEQQPPAPTITEPDVQPGSGPREYGGTSTRTETTAAREIKGRKAVRAGIFSYFVDQFDIYLPIVVLAPAAKYFEGTHLSAGTASILSALVFASTLIGRPFGAAVFGHIADTVGRRKATLTAVAGFGITTLLIAFLPGYASIGLWSIGLLIALRFIDGFFLGGEYTAAVPLAMEWSPKSRRGFISGLITCTSLGASAIIAAITLLLLNVMPSNGVDSAYSQWGWRIPFLVGTVLAVLLFRSYLKEVEDESAVAESITRHRSPLRDLFGVHRRSLAQVLVFMTGTWMATNVGLAVLPGQLKTLVGLTSIQSTIVMLVFAAVPAIAYPMLGTLSQKVGRRRYFFAYGIVVAVGGATSYALLLQLGKTFVVAIILGAIVGVCTICTFAPIAAYLTERFPAAVRASGYGVGYSLSVIVPAFYAFYVSGLTSLFSAQVAPVILLVIAGVLISVGGAIGPETKDIDMGASASG
ncbi:MFS transporter [Rhodococcus sp. WS4]|nr:MFS transporter [Rhodococcus sp. WS4]